MTVCIVVDCERTAKYAGPTCPTHHRRLAAGGEGFVDADGYRWVSAPGHVNSLQNGMIRQHRLVMSEALGRPLRGDENVHHRNGDRADNRLSNLELWCTKQPPGQRISDLIEYSIDLLQRYAPELLAP